MARKVGGRGPSWPFERPAKQPKREKPKNTLAAASNRTAAVDALRKGICLTLTYDDLPRMVEVHTVGISKAERPAMSCYQVGGQSNEGQPLGWRMMCFDECFNVQLSNYPSNAPRPGYRKGAKTFARIEAEI